MEEITIRKEFEFKNKKERDHMRDIDVNLRIILK
jgi:hypothetical protein